jgi:hypothetical protein
MRAFNFCVAGAAAAGALIGLAGPASAAILLQAGNQQYDNVNITGAMDANSVTGTIGNTGDTVSFNNMIGPDFSTQVEEHAANGVAFVESFADSQPGARNTGFSSITLTAEPGTAWTAGSLSLDQLSNNSQGNVSFSFVGTGFASPLISSIALDASGLSKYNFFTTGGEDITAIRIFVTGNANLLQDVRQVSLSAAPVSAIPEPAVWAMMVFGFFGLGRTLRMARAKVLAA